RLRSSHPAVSAFPERVVGSARTSAFSRLARRVTRVAARTLAPSPKCDLLHRRLQPFRHLHDCSGCFRLERFAGWNLHPLESAAFHGAHPVPPFRQRSLSALSRHPSLGAAQAVEDSRIVSLNLPAFLSPSLTRHAHARSS